ncbi:cadherin repeat domain-containing protein [Fibrobacter sp. UWB12]|uniref:cadherin repeat domain-containing protein n=1 Tax=Fibrobacter sp. UWB12 TaxID=1896203 RepID=UPI00090ED48E|nr:cadherin repeat domain-containing protein [Fibrobacter sp. UWB12]SHK67504.1 Cadherin domain-containing protein [Fibrobacter sp. UWB12]
MQFCKMNFKVLISVLVGFASSFAADISRPAPQNVGTGIWVQQIGDIVPHAGVKGTIYYTKYENSDRIKSVDYMYDGAGYLQINIESKETLCALEDGIKGSEGMVLHPDGDLLVAGMGEYIYKVSRTAKEMGEQCRVATSEPVSQHGGFWHLMMQPDGENLWAAGIPGYLYRFSTKTDPGNSNLASIGYKVELEANDGTDPDHKMTTLIWDGEGTAFFTYSDYWGGGCSVGGYRACTEEERKKNSSEKFYFGVITDTTWTEVTSENQGEIGGELGENVITKLGTKILIDSLEGAHGGVYDPYSKTIFVFGGARIVQIQPYREEGLVKAKVVAMIDMREAFFEESVVNLTKPRTSGVGWRLDQGVVDGLGHLFVTSHTGHLIFVDYSSNPNKRIDDNILIHLQWIDNYLDGLTLLNESLPVETYEVSENISSGARFGEFSAYEDDASGVTAQSVSITDMDDCTPETNCAQDLFEIASAIDDNEDPILNKFVFVTKQSLDYEALYKASKGDAVFNIKLTIKDAEENETEKYARIKVTDVNEEPYFTITTDEIEMAENTTVSTVAITFEDKDKFANNNNELVIITDDSGIFEINSDGKIQLKKGAALDYESKNEYEITVRVRDAGVDGDGNLLNPNLYEDKTFKITVTDVNEEPVFAYSSYEYFIREDIDVDVSNLVGSVSAVDPDADATITYSLDGDDAALFDINASTGEIVIKDGTTFDYETKTSYVFVVVASDGKFEVRSLVTVEIVDVNEKPVFEKPSYEFTVEENAEQTVLGSVSAVDHDVDGTVIYSLVGDESESFVINKNTGEITTNENVTFDYESKSSYTFEVVASDEILENRVPVTVNVVDFPESPIFLEDITTVFYIDENASSGTTVGTVVATDDDCKGDFIETCALPTYMLSPFFGYEEYGDLFTIGSGGTIKLAKDGALDYDVKNVYEYHVLATDGSDESLTYSVDITINVRKVAHEPEIADDGHDSYNVAESADGSKTSTGSEIACYVVSDKDPGQVENLSASFTDLGSTKANNFFKAEIKKVGSIYKLCLVVKDGSKLDYETVAHTHKVKISVVDSDNKTASLTKTINITDVNEKPSISGSPTNFFYEHEGKNHLVGQLYADDPDTSKAFTDNIFKAVGGDTDLFMITENGLIKTKRDFDFEKETRFSYTLDVSLYDRNTEKYPDYKSSAKVLISLKNSPNDPVESSSSKVVSSSSAKPASSSSNSKPASSSSKTVASSSSKNIVTPESSVSSSNSNASDYGIPTFHVRVVAPFEFEIVMDESLPRLAKQYAVMDMMGHVISTGELSDKDTRVKVSTRGAYVVRVGLGYKRVNVK